MPGVEPGWSRVCFTFGVAADRLAEYKLRHAAVWPDMLRALQAAGWSRYSLFTRPDGLVVGYFETVDLEVALAKMTAAEVNTLWQEHMSKVAEGGERPDERLVFLDEVFNLDEQLGRAEPDDSHQGGTT